MAFDGITISNIVKDLQDVLTDGRLSKIAQPEPDELLLTIKGKNGQHRLCLLYTSEPGIIHITVRFHILYRSVNAFLRIKSFFQLTAQLAFRICPAL